LAYDYSQTIALVLQELEKAPRTTVAALSRRMGIDRHTLARIARQSTGFGLRELQRRVLIDKVIRVMHEWPNRSIKELSYLMGYGSPRAFRYLVADVWGMSPTALRRHLEVSQISPILASNVPNYPPIRLRREVDKVTFLASAATSGQAQFTAARPNKGACSLDNAMEEMNEQPFGVEFLEEITPTDNTTFGANCTCQIVRVSSSVQGEQTRTECICD